MSVYDLAADKIRALPEPLVEEVNDFIDFLLFKKRDQGAKTNEGRALAEADMGEYAGNLADYEDLLARGEIRW